MILNFTGVNRHGHKADGTTSRFTSAAQLAEHHHGQGWRRLTIRDRNGYEVGGIGPDENGQRSWWGADPPDRSDEIGPRQVGGIYFNWYWNIQYQVLEIRRHRDGWMPWSITVRDLTGPTPGETRTHCTAWDHQRDRVIRQPAPAHAVGCAAEHDPGQVICESLTLQPKPDSRRRTKRRVVVTGGAA